MGIVILRTYWRRILRVFKCTLRGSLDKIRVLGIKFLNNLYFIVGGALVCSYFLVV